MSTPSLFELFRKMHEIEVQLWKNHNIRKEGAYAELLVAGALGAELHSNGVHHGSDLFHADFKRVEVRSRRKPLDGRSEDRVSLADKRGHFEHFVHVLFDSDYSVAGAYIVPHDAIFRHFDASRKRYVVFAEGAALPQSKDIKAELLAVQRRL